MENLRDIWDLFEGLTVSEKGWVQYLFVDRDTETTVRVGIL